MVTKLDTAIGLLKSARNTVQDLRDDTDEPHSGPWWDYDDALHRIDQALSNLDASVIS